MQVERSLCVAQGRGFTLIETRIYADIKISAYIGVAICVYQRSRATREGSGERVSNTLVHTAETGITYRKVG